ncbi:sensor histidine kinase [Kribbella karoonensis]|uniref:Sensor histidine kinase n=1 Tax=Kribbella karoonensis TaxID=324851 RepID=A0ABN2EQU1_9ACTN
MQTGLVTTADSELDRRQAAFQRWAPYFLLGLGTLLALATSGSLTPVTREREFGLAMVGVALVLQVWWTWSGRGHRGPNAVSVTFYVIRWVIACTLTALNGFFAFYVVAGYYDADEMIPGRKRQRLALFACTIPIAGAQTGKWPPHGSMWLAFAGLVVANNVLLTVVKHFAEQQEARSQARADTIAELEQAHEENAALQAQLLVQAREAGIADERRRLAAEIHDTIAQGLTGIIAQLQAATNTSDPDVVQDRVGRASELARHSLGEARRSVQNLAPAGLSYDGLPEAMRKTVDQWSERTGVPAEFTLTGTAQHLHGEFSATLLRITQEALANVSKHAAATRVGVTLSFMDDEVTVDIRDDGKGFDPLALPARSGTGGFGLDGMRARAERIAGSLTVEAEPGFGTAISAHVPLVLNA